MAKAETKQMTINGITVAVSQPYAEGHTINEAEAKALNQVRAENIGNNRRSELKKLLEAEDATPESVQAAAQEIVAAYDKEYVFTLASVGGGSARLDPVTKEARKIARALITDKLSEMGVTQKAYIEANGEDSIKNKIAELAENEKIVEAAKAAVKERNKTSGVTLEL